MARYTGPVCKLCRREGMKLFLKGDRCLTDKCAVVRRPFPPGMHGQRRRKQSEYALQLREKQKARRIYGVLERQFSKHFRLADKMPGRTGETLLQLLETRMDSIVQRAGFADSPAQARQLVNHGHFLLNGQKTDIPSAFVRPGDTVTLSASSRNLQYFKDREQILAGKKAPEWIEVDRAAASARVLAMPRRDQMQDLVQEQLVVEYYSR